MVADVFQGQMHLTKTYSHFDECVQSYIKIQIAGIHGSSSQFNCKHSSFFGMVCQTLISCMHDSPRLVIFRNTKKSGAK